MPETPTSPAPEEFQDSPDSQEIFNNDYFIKGLWGLLLYFYKTKDSLENEEIVTPSKPSELTEKEKEEFAVQSLQNKQLKLTQIKGQIMEYLVQGYIQSDGLIRFLPEFDENDEARFLELPFNYEGEEIWEEVKRRAEKATRVYIPLNDILRRLQGLKLPGDKV